MWKTPRATGRDEVQAGAGADRGDDGSITATAITTADAIATATTSVRLRTVTRILPGAARG
jgi:hypothetical protein